MNIVLGFDTLDFVTNRLMFFYSIIMFVLEKAAEPRGLSLSNRFYEQNFLHYLFKCSPTTCSHLRAISSWPAVVG